MKLAEKSTEELDSIDSESDDYKSNMTSLIKKIKCRNFYIEFINWTTILLLILGISSIITFTSLNSMSKEKTKTEKPVAPKSRTLGRTIPVPPIPPSPKTFKTDSNDKK